MTPIYVLFLPSQYVLTYWSYLLHCGYHTFASFLPISWSDLSAVITTLASLVPSTKDSSWTINYTILSRPSHRLVIESALKKYLYINSPDISSLTLLEAHKPVIKGTCVSQASFLNKEKHLTQQGLKTAFNNAHMAFHSDSFQAKSAGSQKKLG